MNLKSAWLTTNRSCNCRCEWCYAQKTLGPKEAMDIDIARMAVEELKKRQIKKIVLIGGEPTVYKHFLELVQTIHNNGIKCTVATNGIAFKDIDFAKATIEAGVDSINISLKATTEDDYVKYTGTRALENVLSGYNNLKMLGFKPVFSYVIVNDDEAEFENLINLLESNSIRQIGFQFVKPVIELEKKESIMDIRAMAHFTEYIYERMKKTNIKYGIEISFPLCLIRKEILDNLILEGKINTCCHVQKGSGIVFDTDFKVLPCNHFAEYPFNDTPIDFSKSNSIEELWCSDEVINFRNKSRCYPSDICASCKLWNICGGGCFTRWLFISPKDYINNNN